MILFYVHSGKGKVARYLRTLAVCKKGQLAAPAYDIVIAWDFPNHWDCSFFSGYANSVSIAVTSSEKAQLQRARTQDVFNVIRVNCGKNLATGYAGLAIILWCMPASEERWREACSSWPPPHTLVVAHLHIHGRGMSPPDILTPPFLFLHSPGYILSPFPPPSSPSSSVLSLSLCFWIVQNDCISEWLVNMILKGLIHNSYQLSCSTRSSPLPFYFPFQNFC